MDVVDTKIDMLLSSSAFASLTEQARGWLLKQLQYINVPADTVLYVQGTESTKSYLICNGKIELSEDVAIERKTTIMLTEKGDSFGETEIILECPYYYTAKTLSDCQLAILTKEVWENLVELDSSCAESIFKAAIDNCLPKKNSCVTMHQHAARNTKGQVLTTLRNLTSNKYFQLSPEGMYIWEQIDGKKSLKEICALTEAKYSHLTKPIVSSLLFSLNEKSFIELVHFSFQLNDAGLPNWIRVMRKVTKMLEYHYVFQNPNTMLTNTYNKFFKIFFTTPAYIIMPLMMLIGIIAFSVSVHKAVQFLFQYPLQFFSLSLIAFFFNLSTGIMHEFAHAYTTKKYGQLVNKMGIGWYWISFIAYTDTTDMWLKERWPRILVNVAGIYVDMVSAGVFAVFAYYLPFGWLATMCWLVSLGIYFRILQNLDPVIELDGYYILADVLNRPFLREDAVTWLAENVKATVLHPSQLKKYKMEILYWSACVVHTIITTVIAWTLQYYVFSKVYPLEHASLISSILPVLLIALALFSVYAQVNSQRKSVRLKILEKNKS